MHTALDFVLARSWSCDKTDEARLLVEQSNMLSLGWNVITRAAPSWWHVNLGTTYLNGPLATVHHLYTVSSSKSFAGISAQFVSE